MKKISIHLTWLGLLSAIICLIAGISMIFNIGLYPEYDSFTYNHYKAVGLLVIGLDKELENIFLI